MKGYDITIKAFIPFDPSDMFVMQTKNPVETVACAEADLKNGGATQVSITTKYRQRKKAVDADLPLGLDGGAAE